MLDRLLSLTLAGTASLVLVWAVEALFPNIWSCRWRYYIRLLPLFAFLMPVVRPVILLPPSYEPPIFLDQPLEIFTSVNDTLAVTPSSPVVWPKAMLVVWLAGTLAFAVYRLCVWGRFSAAVRRAAVPAGETEQRILQECLHTLKLRQKARLFICPGIGAPALAGLLCPGILLPHPEMAEEELRLILHHELMHLRRRDIAYKLAVQLICIVHWFNPSAWLLAHQVNELCELSCDEIIVQGWNDAQRRRYGNAILDQIAQTRHFLPPGIPGFSAAKQILLQRMIVIMKIRKHNKKYAIAASLTTLALCATCTITAFALAPADLRHAVTVIVPGEWEMENSYAARLKGATLTLSDNKAKDEEPRLLPAKDAGTEKTASAESVSKANATERLLPAKDADAAKLTPDDSTLQPVETEQPLPEKKDTPIKLVPTNSVYQFKQDGGPLVPAEGVAAPELELINPVSLANIRARTLGIMGYKGHTGMDFAAPEGTEIFAAADGEVSQAKIAGGAFGNYLTVSHGGGIRTLYAQCQKLLVEEGDQVKQGQVIATVGSTGRTTGPHLHFELRMGEYVLDPEQYMPNT